MRFKITMSTLQVKRGDATTEALLNRRSNDVEKTI